MAAIALGSSSHGRASPGRSVDKMALTWIQSRMATRPSVQGWFPFLPQGLMPPRQWVPGTQTLKSNFPIFTWCSDCTPAASPPHLYHSGSDVRLLCGGREKNAFTDSMIDMANNLGLQVRCLRDPV